MRRLATRTLTLVLGLGLVASCKGAPPPAPEAVPRFALATVVRDLAAPRGLAVTADGAYVATGQGLMLVGPEGSPQLLAGPEHGLQSPAAVAVATGAVFVADPGSHRVWRKLQDMPPEPFAGTGTTMIPIGDGGLAISAQLDRPVALHLTSGGDLLVLDAGHRRLRRIDPEGRITTLAGDGQARMAGDGHPAREASFREPGAFALAADGSMAIADTGNHAIRRIDPQGAVSTVAGTGRSGFSEDGAVAAQSPLASPSGVVFYGAGLLFSEEGSHRIRYLGPDGRLYTVAGSGQRGTSDEAPEARQAQLDAPGALTLAPDGTPFFVDRRGGRLYQLRPATASAAP